MPFGGGGGGGGTFNGGTITEPLVIDLSANPANQRALHVVLPSTFDFSVDAFTFEVDQQFALLRFTTTGAVSAAGNILATAGGALTTQGGVIRASKGDGSNNHVLDPTTSGGKIGLFAAPPVVQQAKPTDVTSIVALLVAYGLCAP